MPLTIKNHSFFIFFCALRFWFSFFFSALNLLHPHIKTKSNACHQKTFHIVSLLKFIAVLAKSFNIFQFQCKFMLKNGDEKNSILCYPSKGSPIWRKLAMLLGGKKFVHSFYYHRRVHRSSALLNLHIFFFSQHWIFSTIHALWLTPPIYTNSCYCLCLFVVSCIFFVLSRFDAVSFGAFNKTIIHILW